MSDTNDNPKQYFKKTIASTPFFANGKRIPFELLNGNIGVIALDISAEHETIVALDKAVMERRGGVTKLQPEEYESIKKKAGLKQLERRPNRAPLQVFKPLLPVDRKSKSQGNNPVVVAAATNPAKNGEEAPTAKPFEPPKPATATKEELEGGKVAAENNP